MATPIILRMEHGQRMSDEQRLLQLRKQVSELQRALKAAQEENELLTYERDELVQALKSWAQHDEQSDHNGFDLPGIDDIVEPAIPVKRSARWSTKPTGNNGHPMRA